MNIRSLALITTLALSLLFPVSVCPASNEHLGPAIVLPSGSNSQVDVGAMCMIHVSRISQLLEMGHTREQILADFEAWLSNHEPISPQYPTMVREMIESSKQANWQQGAFTQCVRVMTGNGT